MFSFLKKKKPDYNTSANVEEFKSVTQDLYKKNLEITLKNKVLSILSTLYEISVLSLNPKELSDRVCSAIEKEFNFELVAIFLIDNERLSTLGISEAERIKSIEGESNIYLRNLSLADVSDNIFLGKIIEEKKAVYTEDLADIYGKMIPKEMYAKIVSLAHIRSSILHPIIIDNKVTGFFMVSTNRIYDNLINYERDSIKNFANVISVALNKALLYEKLEDANAGQKNLIHVMNHQIKAYLGINKNIFAELLTDDYGNMPEATKPLLQKGLEESTAGVTYVTEILKGASAENGSLPYDMKPIDFKELVSTVVSKQIEIAENKGLKLDLNIEKGNYNIIADTLQLGEAIKNLISNSINYTPTGSVSVNLLQEGDKILLIVKDTGIGIKDEDKGKLFKAGGVGKDSIKVNVNSSGYGLVFAKGVIEAHKGKVWFESAGEGKGTTFFVDLPVK